MYKTFVDIFQTYFKNSITYINLLIYYHIFRESIHEYSQKLLSNFHMLGAVVDLVLAGENLVLAGENLVLAESRFRRHFGGIVFTLVVLNL